MTSFNTLQREHSFRHPSHSTNPFPKLSELISPHLKSFNALFEGHSTGAEGNGKSLLQLAIEDLEPRVIFDNNEKVNEGLGNRLEGTFYLIAQINEV